MRWRVLLAGLGCLAALRGQSLLVPPDGELSRLTGGQTHLVTSRGAAAPATGGPQVLLDVDGPGVVTRLWFVKPDGRLRVLVDGESEPRLEQPLATLPTASLWPRPDGFSQLQGGGLVCHLTIGFRRHLRLEVSGARPLAYELTWATVPAGQTAPEFAKVALAPPVGSPEHERLMREEMEAITKRLQAARSSDMQRLGLPRLSDVKVTVPAGGSATVYEASGAGCLQQLMLAPEPDALGVLRGLRLRATWDGAPRPSIDAPLADLLGMACGRRGSATTGYSALYGYKIPWPMPHQRSAKVELVNTGSQPVQVNATRIVRARVDGEGYLNATGTAVTPAAGQPVTLLDASARGKYVATLLALAGDAPAALAGTVRFVADGGPPQESLDTGAYFGVAGRVGREPVTGAFEGIVPIWPDGSQLTASRSHSRSSVSFERSLKVTLDHGAANEVTGCRYRTLALWYASEPAMPPPMPADDPGPPRTLSVGRALVVEAESLTPTLSPGSAAKAKVVDESELTYAASGGKALAFWAPAGQAVHLRLPVPHDGIYRVGWRAGDDGVWDVCVRSGALALATGAYTGERDGTVVAAQASRGIDVELFRSATMSLPDGLAFRPIEAPRGTVDCFWLSEIPSVRDAIEAEVAAPWLQVWRGDLSARRLERSPMVQGAELSDEAIDSGGGYVRLQPGNSRPLTFTLRVPKTGRYGLALGVRQGPGAGAVRVLVDKREVATIDCGASEALVGARFGLGTFSFAPLRKPVKGPSHRPAGAPAPPLGGYHTVLLQPVDQRPVDIDYLLMRPDAAGQEAEFMTPDAGTAGSLVIWERSGQEPAWSGGSYARVEGAAPGHSARFTVTVPKAGRYRVRVMPARLPGGVPTRVWLAGRRIGVMACAGDKLGLGRSIARTVRLPAGRQTLALEATTPGTIALDYLRIDRRRAAWPWWLALGLAGVWWLRRRRLQVAPEVPTGD